MKLFNFVCAWFIIAFLLTSCNENQDNPVTEKKNSYLLYTQKITEKFSDSVCTGKEIVKYHYEMPNDHFWSKAVYSDENSEITKTVTRKFDQNRLPVSETTEELGTVTVVETKFDLLTHEPLLRLEYNGEAKPQNKTKSIAYTYDSTNTLFSQEVTIFSDDTSFVNADGKNITDHYVLRHFPYSGTRPHGNFSVFQMIEKRTKYYTSVPEKGDHKIGDVEIIELTEFDKNGLPTYHKISKPDCHAHARESWYKIESDGVDQVISITGYMNKELDSISGKNRKTIFEYNSEGFIETIHEYKYNPTTSEFDQLHDKKTLSWITPEIESSYNYTDASVESEHYCFGSKNHSKYLYNIVKYDNIGKKVTEEYYDSYQGDYKSQELNPKLLSRTTLIYDMYVFDGKSGVVKKHTHDHDHEHGHDHDHDHDHQH